MDLTIVDSEGDTNSKQSSEESESEVRPVRKISRSFSSSSNSPDRFKKPMGSPAKYLIPSENSDDGSPQDDEVRPTGHVAPTEQTNSNDVIQTSCFQFIYAKAVEFYKTIMLPEYFLLFNVICVTQAVPAIYYYVSFFQRGFILENSSGMPPVWGATIGSICSTIVGSALAPLPKGLITRPFAIAVIVWDFVIALFVFIATVCMGILGDNLGVVWGVLCVLSSLASGSFLLYLGLNFDKIKDEHHKKYHSTPSSDSHTPGTAQSDLEMVNIETGDALRATEAAENSGAAEGDAEPSTAAKVTQVALQTLLWLVLFVFYLIPIGFGIGQAMTAHEQSMYPKPGMRYKVASAPQSDVTVQLHLFCRGPTNSARPTIVVEADAGTSGFAYYALQNALSQDYNWRVCVYDRPGYGWSDMSKLGSNSIANYLSRLNELLTVSGEEAITPGGKFLFVGHGEGGEQLQTYAYTYPASVAGLALLDAYPSAFRLRQDSTKEIKKESEALCGNYQILRALDSVAYARPVSDVYNAQAEGHDAQFTPNDELRRYKSTQTNGKFWASQFSDFCLHPKAFTFFTDYLSQVGTQSGAVSTVLWPQLANGVPVLIVVASYTVQKSSDAKLFYSQSLDYNSTLSPSGSSRWLLCADCRHSFPIDGHSAQLAQQIDQYFAPLL